jgi:hypothetical protein
LQVKIIGLNEGKDTLLISKKEYDERIKPNTKAELDKDKIHFPDEGYCTFRYQVYDEIEYTKRLSLVSMLLEEIDFWQKENNGLLEKTNTLNAEVNELKLALVPNESETVINEGFKEEIDDGKGEVKEEKVEQPVKKRPGRPKGKKLYEGYD